jgi:hypothetical protein
MNQCRRLNKRNACSRLTGTRTSFWGKTGGMSMSTIGSLMLDEQTSVAATDSPHRSGTNAGGGLELIFEQIDMDLIFFTPPPRDGGTSWALASPERH